MPSRWVALVFALAFALCASQSLGLWHRAQHGLALQLGSLPLAPLQVEVEPQATANLDPGESAREGVITLEGGVAPPWGHLAGQADCQLLDHLLLADAPPSAGAAPQALLVLLAQPQPPAQASWHARATRPYQARAPPARFA